MDRLAFVALASLGSLVLSANGARADKTEDDAVKALKASGAEVIRDKKAPGQPVVTVDLEKLHLDAADLRPLRQLKSLKSLDMRFATVDEDAWKELGQLKSV